MLLSREKKPAPGSSTDSAKAKHLWSQMIEVERRQWRLWASAIAITLLLTLGILSFSFPLLLGGDAAAYILNLNISMRGLVGAVLLFDIYAIHQQLQIFRIRKRLQRSERLFNLIGEHAADLIAVVDMQGNRLYNSPSYEKILGYTPEDLAGSSNLDQIHPDDMEKVIAAAEEAKQTGIGRPLEYRMRHKNGSWRILESTASVVRNELGQNERLVIVNRDITMRKQAEAELQEREHQLRQAQKMEAVGRLSGGIAHDFNNLLSVIIGYADELDTSRGETEKLRRNAEQIKKAGLRAASLTRQLLAFSRQQVLQPKVLELNAVVAELAKMLRRLIGADVELKLNLDSRAGRVKADQSQLDQVIVNLVVNARDAMPEGGKLTIETANTELGEQHSSKMPYVKPGSYVQLTVADTGTGMSAEVIAHIFEPFFTTKEKGKGTGLGLSTVYGIIKQSDGYIWVDSKPGKGTSFQIFLPREMEAAPALTVQAAAAPRAASSSTVLVVEDEESLRELITDLLERNGYQVLPAADGAEALKLARSSPAPIHLLLTDVVLPGIGGPILARQLAADQPGIRILYMSGYSDFNALGRGTVPPDARLLQKPFTKEVLLQLVSEVLSRTGSEVPA
jgi:two-component system, cell cycle sensor histidine kinase and response regulator CckA